MFGMGMLEIGIVAVVLIVVVGPDDLPGLLRTVGRWVGSMQGMARDFRKQIDTMADDAGFAEEKKLFDQARSMNPNKMVQDFIDPKGEMAKEMAETDDDLRRKASFAAAQDAGTHETWQPEVAPKPAAKELKAPKATKPKAPKAKAPSKAKAKSPKAASSKAASAKA